MSIRQRRSSKKKNSLDLFDLVDEEEKRRGMLEYLCEPVDNSSLVAYRVMWGIIMFYECTRFSARNFIKADQYYVKPEFHGKYYGFEWVEAWGQDGIHMHLYLMMFAALGIATGFAYPLCTLFFALSWTYFILLDSIIYLNHFYLIAVIAFLLALLPANRCFSIDSLIFPKIYSTSMPRYILWLLRAEQVIVYFFAGFAKINEDWLRGEPIKHWLALDQSRLTMLRRIIGGGAVKFICSELGAYVICYSGMLFDLSIGFLLLLPRGIFWYCSLTACLFFHIMNKMLFSIGIFPFVMLASTTLFFEPDWARKYFPWILGRVYFPSDARKKKTNITTFHKVIILFSVLFLLHQVILPIRSSFYEGDVAWNEKGHRWSWRMKLREKECTEKLIGKEPKSNETFLIETKSFLVGKQYRKLITYPVEIAQLARYISWYYHKEHGIGPLEIYAEINCSLNYRGMQPFLNSSVNLVEFDYWDFGNNSLVHALLPLTEQQKKEYPWNWDWAKIMQLLDFLPVSDLREHK